MNKKILIFDEQISDDLFFLFFFLQRKRPMHPLTT